MLVTLFLIFVFSASIVTRTEAKLNLIELQEEMGFSQNSVNTDLINDSACEELKMNHCDEGVAHCSHHCSGVHNASLQENLVQINTPSFYEYEPSWYLKNHFTTLLLKPAIEPPIFS